MFDLTKDSSLAEMVNAIRTWKLGSPGVEEIVVDPRLIRTFFEITCYDLMGYTLITDHMRDHFYETGRLVGFMGVEWVSTYADR